MSRKRTEKGTIVAERNAVKPRECDTCGKKVETTAAGIKKHAEECKV